MNDEPIAATLPIVPRNTTTPDKVDVDEENCDDDDKMTTVEAMAKHFNAPLRLRDASSETDSVSASVMRSRHQYRVTFHDEHVTIERKLHRLRDRPWK